MKPRKVRLKPGRKRISEALRKIERAYVTTTSVELAQIDAMAEKKGLSRMALMRKFVDSGMKWKGSK